MELEGRIIVYSIVGCPHCIKAKGTLTQHELPFTDISVDKYPSVVRDGLVERAGKRTVPQIFFNDHHIGGNTELDTLLENEEKWKAMIEELKTTPPPEDAPIPPDESTKLPEEEEDAGDLHCEPDKHGAVVESLKASGIIGTHRTGFLTLHRATFKGSNFVNWLVREEKHERASAMALGQGMLDNQLACRVEAGPDNSDSQTFMDDNTLYRLLDEEDSNALNNGKSECAPRPASDLGEEMRKIILRTYSLHLSADGKKVDYKGISESSDFAKYKKLSLELSRVNLTGASREEKLAFFINIYNALVIHATVVRGPPSNMFQRFKFFNRSKYIIGGASYSLQDIENGILRANRKGVGMLFRPFGSSDRRLSVALEQHEPLIHFALVCGAKSCPPIKTYSTGDVMAELRLAAESFLEGEDGCIVVCERREVSLSRIFQWYRIDFAENNEQLAAWVHKTMPDGQKKEDLGKLIKEGNFKVKFMNYDWSLNS